MECRMCGYRWCWVCGSNSNSLWHSSFPIICLMSNDLNIMREKRPCSVFIVEILAVVLFPLLALLGLAFILVILFIASQYLVAIAVLCGPSRPSKQLKPLFTICRAKITFTKITFKKVLRKLGLQTNDLGVERDICGSCNGAFDSGGCHFVRSDLALVLCACSTKGQDVDT